MVWHGAVLGIRQATKQDKPPAGDSAPHVHGAMGPHTSREQETGFLVPEWKLRQDPGQPPYHQIENYAISGPQRPIWFREPGVPMEHPRGMAATVSLNSPSDAALTPLGSSSLSPQPRNRLPVNASQLLALWFQQMGPHLLPLC